MVTPRSRRPTSVRPCCATSSDCSTSRRSTSPPAGWPASRPCSAGSTRATACSLRADFLDAIGAYGLWNRVTGWVLDHAIADAAGWHAAGATIRVWVNVAASDVSLHSSLPQQVHRALLDHGLPGDLLGLELTESGVLRNLDDAVSVLGSLRTSGVEIALDDFGTGFSSLTHLRRLPFNAVKIDRSFVQSIDSSAPDAAITGAVIESADHSASTASSRASNGWPSGTSSPDWERHRSRATSSPVPARPRTYPDGSRRHGRR